MALSYLSIVALVWLTALPEEPWSFPASWTQSKDRGYLMVDSISRCFSQAQASFEYELLCF